MIEILNYKEINKGAVKGSFSVKFKKWGDMIIHEMTLFEKSGRQWVNYPSRQYESNGEKKYMHYIWFEDKKVDQQIKDKILETLTEFLKNKPQSGSVTPEADPFADLPF